MALYERNLRHRGSGSFMKGRSGQALGSRKLVYRANTGTWNLADADALTTLPVVGITMGPVNSGQIVEILLEGFIGSTAWTWTRGDTLYASQVAGELVAVAPTPPASAQMVAVALTPTTIYFNGLPASRGVAAGAGGVDDFTYLVERTGANYTVYDDHGVIVHGPGVDADTEINWALTTGGAGCVVYLKEQCTFAINDPITFTANNQVICGGGRSSFIDGDGLATGEHGIVLSGFDNCIMRDFSIQTQDGGGKTCHCIFIEDGADNFLIKHVDFIDSDDNCLHVEGTTINIGYIDTCHIDGSDGYGIYVNMDAGSTINRLNIINNDIVGVGNAGIYFDASDGNYYCVIESNIIAASAGIGIYVNDFVSGQIIRNECLLGGLSGIHVVGSISINVTDNQCLLNERHGIFFTSTTTDSLIAGNVCNDNDNSDTATYDGINLDTDCSGNVITNNVCERNHNCGIAILGAENLISNNKTAENDRAGIYVNQIGNTIDDNRVLDNGQDAAGTYHGMHLGTLSSDCQISGNYVDGYGDSQEDCIHLETGVDNCHIEGNYCYDGMGSGICLIDDNDDNHLEGNYLINNDDYGVEITTANAAENIVKENFFLGNGTRPILDNGTDTALPTLTFDFTHYGGGSAGWTAPIISTSPGGIDIDADDEFCYCHVALPSEVRQVVRISIWAYSNTAWAATNVLNMLLRIVVHGGGSTEAWNTHTIDVPNYPSEEDGLTGIAVYDVIHWIIDRAVSQEMDNLAFHDFLQILAVGEAAVPPDLATDAMFGGVEIEYV